MTHAFINIYFDLYEIARRKLEASLNKNRKNKINFYDIYGQFESQFNREMDVFLKDVDRGTNRVEMLKWNKFVKEELGIDNLLLFTIYQD